MNASQFLRAISGFLFCFVLFFEPNTAQAQAGVFQKMVQNLPDIPQSQIQKVFGILEDLDIDLKDLDKDDMRALALALDDPIHLVEGSRLAYGIGIFGIPFFSSFYHAKRSFFFTRFDLHRDSDALFTKLFTLDGEEKIKLPFRDAKRNWDNFVDAIEKAESIGYDLQFTKIDLEAAAISFIHQRLSDRSFSNPTTGQSLLNSFFDRKFTIAHYMNPHFTLTGENPYHQSIMMRISNEFFLTGENLSLINSKEFILKMWSNIIQEITEVEYVQRSSTFAFLDFIVDSIVKCRGEGSSMRDHDFLKALEEAARENNHLAKVVGVVKDLVSRPQIDLRTIIPELLRKIMLFER